MYDGLKKIYALLTGKERKSLFILFFTLIIGAVLELFSLGVLPGFIALVADPSLREKHTAIDTFLDFLNVHNQKELLVVGSIIIILTFLTKNIYITWMVYTRVKIASQMQIRLTYKLLSLYFYAPYTFHLSRNTADLFSRASDQVRMIVSNVLLPFMAFVMDFMFTLVTLALVIAVEPLISLAAFCIFGLAIIIYWFTIRKRSLKHGKELTFKRKEMYKKVFEGFGGLKDARVLNREQYFLDRSIESFKVVTFATMYQHLISKLSKPFLETIAVLSVLSMAILITLQDRPIQSLLPVLALFVVASIKLLPNVNNMIANYTGMRSLMIAIDPVYEDIMGLEDEAMHINDQDTTVMSFTDSISIKELDYRYPESHENAINCLSLTIKKGEAIGFVGPSGAGKTTLVDIILGLLIPTDGAIIVDSKNIFDDIRQWQKNIGYVPQQIYLSDNTIKNNIAFGLADQDISDIELWNAIKASQLEELINELPAGIDTTIGERGVRLSGGQRQRIGIARALYHNPQVLILDEATAALDNITERYVIDSIDRLKGDRTIITVAHRLTTVKKCDRLYLLKKGQIVAQGSFEDLLEKNDEFKEMNV